MQSNKRTTTNSGDKQVINYLKTVIEFARARLVLVLFLLVIVGLTDGIGLIMLVPFLHIVGFSQQEQAPNLIVETMGQALNSINLPLNLASVLTLYIALITLRSALLRWREIVLSEIRLGYVDNLRIQLYDSIGRANWIYLSKKRTSDLTHVLTSDINRIAQGTHFILEILVTGFVALVYIIVAFQLSFVMTLIALMAGAALLLILRPQVRKAKTLGAKLTQTNRKVFGTVSDFFGGIKLVKSYAAEKHYSQSFNHSLLNLRTQLLAFTKSNSFAQMIYQIGAAVILSMLFYIAAVVLEMPGAELLVLILIFARLLPLLSQLQRSYQHFVHMLPAFASAMEIYEECEKEQKYLTAPAIGSLP